MRRIRSINLMWYQACEVLDRADRLHRQFFRLGQVGRLPVWEPPVDIFESDAEILVRVAMPDVDLDTVEVSKGDGRLRLAGRRRLPAEAAQGRIRQLEIPYGRMERTIALPAGRLEVSDKSYRRGCLEIRLRRGTSPE